MRLIHLVFTRVFSSKDIGIINCYFHLLFEFLKVSFGKLSNNFFFKDFKGRAIIRGYDYSRGGYYKFNLEIFSNLLLIFP